MRKLMRSLLLVLLCAVFTLPFAMAEEPALQLDYGTAVTRTYTVETGDAEPAEALEIVLFKGKSHKLDVQLNGVEDAKQAKITWSTSDKSIVTVSGGKITGKKAGTAVVTCTATLKDGTVLETSVQVTVEVKVTKLSAKSTTIKVNAGYTTEPVAIKIAPADATCQNLIWTSADESIATVDESGRITGVSIGKTKITVTSAEQSDKPVTLTLNVTVQQPVADLTLDQSDMVLAKGATGKLTATVTPDNAATKKLTWTSSDTKVATVSGGKVTAKGPGTAVITCTTTDGTNKSASCTVEVYAPVTGVTISSKKETVHLGTEGPQLSVSVKPLDAKYYEVTWSSSDESIATVDQTGKVTPVAGGKATITATVTSTKSATAKARKVTCTVTVTQAVSQITIGDSDSMTLAKGKSVTLKAVALPETASNRKVTWTSSDPKVATVNASGKVTAKGVGTATITATAADGSGVTDTIVVNVYQPVTGLSAKSTKVSVTKGKTVYLSVTVKPADAADKTITWSSNNTSIATVDSNGRVTGVSAGQCKITAVSNENPQKKVTFTVTVEPVIPLDATKFTRSGYFGAYYEFAITFKNMTKSRTVTYIGFDLKYDYNGKTYSSNGYYTDDDRLGPGATRKIGWWDQLGYRLSYYTNFRVYLTSVRYSDGTWEYFYDDNLIGWFN